MNRLARKIAWRYLFSKKSHSAINAISIVSVCGVAITTLALVCTLSVYNGFTELIGSLYSQIDPQIKITPLQGKTLDTEEEAKHSHPSSKKTPSAYTKTGNGLF